MSLLHEPLKFIVTRFRTPMQAMFKRYSDCVFFEPFLRLRLCCTVHTVTRFLPSRLMEDESQSGRGSPNAADRLQTARSAGRELIIIKTATISAGGHPHLPHSAEGPLSVIGSFTFTILVHSISEAHS
jgi:hypothetical protein